MENILEVRNLSRSFDGFKLENISFSLPRGYIMGLIGPNGAGKTTTIKLIMNLIRKASGEIKIFGLDYQRHEMEIKHRIGFVYDENHYYEELSVAETGRLIGRFYREWDDSVFDRYVKRFDLPRRTKVKDLSRGMKSKLGLALALSHNAEMIILDEPTSGLDPVFRAELLEILAELLQDERKGIIFSTHITTDLDRVADYVCFINQGRVVFCESKDEILDSHVVVRGGSELLNQQTRSLFTGVRSGRFGFEALSREPTSVKKALGNRVVMEKATLEQIMLFTVRGDN